MTCSAIAEAWVWVKIGLGAWIALALVAWVLAAVLWARAWRRRRAAGEAAAVYLARHEAWLANPRAAGPGSSA